MTELETMQRAKMYLDKLAQGIDPITDRELPEDTVLNQVRLARCFFFVSDVLGKVIANGGSVGGVLERRDFHISREQLERVQLSPEPVRISQLTEMISAAVGDPQMKKLGATVITNWLLQNGFLEKQMLPDGKSRRVPSAKGIQIGLVSQLRQGRDGEYLAIFYPPEAQRFVLDHLPAMIGEKIN